LVDRALPARQFTRLRRAIEALGTERLRSSYQTTFWFDFEQAPSNLVDAARAAEILGWTPQVPLAEGLALTAAWFADRAP
jgi:nucleoside-diphosphate-sugar epimerase